MLGELARHSALPVPAVHVAEPDLLVMDFIETDGGGITPQRRAPRRRADRGAACHAARPSFGYERDTLIGPLPQPNPKSRSLDPLLPRSPAARHGAGGASGRSAAGEAARPASSAWPSGSTSYLTEPRHPSLLHGDLWTGNVLVRGDRIAGFVDPAIYCGHPEIELAFTTMFGTFGPSILRRL